MGKDKQFRPTLSKGSNQPVETPADGATLNGFGLTLLSAGTTGLTFTLPAPEPGMTKFIAYTAASTEASLVYTNSTTTTLGGTTNDTLSFDAAGEAVLLMGASTGSWAVIANNGSVALSATTH